MHRLLLPLALAASAAIAAPASAAPVSLPTLQRTATAPVRACDTTSYVAPMSGYVTGRLSGAASSDWDLGAVDHATDASLSQSRGFRSREVVQSWVQAGQKVDFVACHRSGPARSASLAITLLDVKPPVSAGPVSLVRVQGSDAAIEKLEARGLDVTHMRGKGWADVLATGAQRSLIARLGLASTVRTANLDDEVATTNAADARYAARMGAAGSPLPSGSTGYRSYPEIQEDLKKLVAEHPDEVRPVVIGQTFQGNDIEGVEIAKDVKGDDGRPTFFLMGAHHAREWPSAEVALEYAHLLVKEQSDPRVASLFARERTTIVPVVNVDGFISTHDLSPLSPTDNITTVDPDDEVSNQLPSTPFGNVHATAETVEAVAPPGGILAYRRKNCDGAIPDGNVPCVLQWGVDNNRNYGNLWGGPGSSQDPTSQSYHGPGPRSEPETQAVWNYSQAHQVTGLMTLHTIAALVLRPPGLHDGGKAPDEIRMKELGDAMADATKYVSQYSFQLYDTAGTTEDDTYAAQGGYGYTIELGPSGGLFHEPYERAVVQQWERGDNPAGTTKGGMRNALLLMGESAANPADHGILTGTTTPGATLRLKKTFDTETSPFCSLGADPVITVAATPDAVACPEGVQAPQTLKDTFETTTKVPASGAFEWHVNPSTRPFIGGGAIIEGLAETPAREVTFTGDPSTAVGGGSFSEDHAFSILPSDPKTTKIDVTWDTPEDYDIEVYRKNADGSLGDKVGSSGNSPGEPEQVLLTGDQAAPGDYVLRVLYFAAVTGDYTAKVGAYSSDPRTTTGHPESYTMTCEVGGSMVKSTEVFVARGQTLGLDPCSTATAQAVSGGDVPNTESALVASSVATGIATADTVAKAPAAKVAPKKAAAKKKATAKKKLTKTQLAAKKRAAAKRKAAAKKRA
jgi:hypothetical protein